MDAEGLSDEELLRRFVEGNDDAFTSLVRRHEDRLFSLAYRMTGARADALDVLQETFLSAARRAASFKGEASFGTWLYRIAVNASHDLVRKQARQAIPHDDLPEPRVTQEAVDDMVTARVDISSALATLPDDYRKAVAMHDIGGIPYDEIARITRAPIGTVKSRISRGRRMLGALLEQRLEAKTSKEVS